MVKSGNLNLQITQKNTILVYLRYNPAIKKVILLIYMNKSIILTS